MRWVLSCEAKTANTSLNVKFQFKRSKMAANSYKRKRYSVEPKICVIFNSECDDNLHEGTERGLAKLKEATNTRAITKR